jgi:Lactoylglutathione lyase and related lyases
MTDKRAVDIRGMAPLLEVYDMAASLHFYCNLLGFEIVMTAGPEPDYHWVWLSSAGTEIMLNTMYEPGERPPSPEVARAKHHGDTTLYFGCANVDEAVTYMRGKGVTIDALHTTSYGMRQLHLTDPDGYRLCFQWPTADEMFAIWQQRYGRDFRNG